MLRYRFVHRRACYSVRKSSMNTVDMLILIRARLGIVEADRRVEAVRKVDCVSLPKAIRIVFNQVR